MMQPQQPPQEFQAEVRMQGDGISTIVGLYGVGVCCNHLHRGKECGHYDIVIRQ
jgi:hypothetical protein